MNEYFLHTIWNHQSFIPYNLTTVNGKTIVIHEKGSYNHTNGPDFKLAEISIDKEKFEGDIEIHIKSSDWIRHNHHKDIAYNNVILHVVFDDDKPVFKKNGSPLETLVLKQRINLVLAQTVHSKNDLLCFGCKLTPSTWQQQSSRSLKLRYERKKSEITRVLEQEFHGDWWLCTIWVLLKAFLGNQNGDLAVELIKNIQKRILLTVRSNHEITSYLLGIANLYEKLSPLEKQLFETIKFKYQLPASSIFSWKYKEIRPSSFPELRIRQFADWIYQHRNSLDMWFMENRTVDEFKVSLINSYVNPNPYPLGESKINEIIINGFLLLQYCKANSSNSLDTLSQYLKELPTEKNTISKKFQTLIPPAITALDSQQTLSQYQEFCKKKNCLNCLVGCEVLGRTSMK